MPTWDQVRERVNALAAQDGEWAGYPMPVDRLRLVVEPRHPRPGLNGFCLDEEEREAGEFADITVRNHWYSERRGARVYVCQEAGKVFHALLPERAAWERLNFWTNTLGVAAGCPWTLEAEANAQEKLYQLVGLHKFKCYALCGAFLETSERSRVTYMFRRLRPTLALRPTSVGTMACIAALCLHPIGYYEQSWAGVMVPTDDVIAHLMMMRGDERKFWAHANQHDPDGSAAGI